MDALVDEAAHLPRKLGYAPKNAEIYPSDSDRIAARWVHKKIQLLFSKMFQNSLRSSIILQFKKLIPKSNQKKTNLSILFFKKCLFFL
jgi:hypothetical protein